MTPPPIQPPKDSPRRGRPVVLAGMAAAAALGTGLGLWARPAPEPEAKPEPVAEEPPAAAEPLQIVVDDRPAPIGAPLVVLPPPPVRQGAQAKGVMKVADPAEAPAPLPVVVLTRDEPPPPAPEPPAVPKAKPKPAPAPKTTTVAAAKAKPKPVVTAKADVAKPRRAKPAPVRVAKADPVSPKPAKVKPQAARRKAVQMAQAKPAPKPAKAAKPKSVRVEVARAKPAPKPVVRGEGPRRVAAADPCARSDRAEAMVCSDSRLSARDRQMQRAYRAAEAAGVPEAALRRQQVRWLAARAAAAREAPWAVEDVYLARIAELNDLADDAREN